ncbi:Putative pectinesterase/pectinesterase inhibitor 28 [Triticum urartu]|uniref:Pectinesterase n=1 Tax=Triticum urartu TaxID=4572 RepID=M7ZIH0_TRIUA|nr:pectinesterase-like [Triticum urartu]EMS59431.1 Putative pectinesterase/pectinesterase inhibitor 28 [Triticum urartu]
MSSGSAFGDFGPLTERRKAEKARQVKKRIMVAVGTIAIILIVCGIVVTLNGKQKEEKDGSSSKKGSKGKSDGGGGEDGGGDLKAVKKTITMMCKQVDYQGVCEESLTRCAKANESSPLGVLRLAVRVIGEALSEAFDRAELILTNDLLVKGAIADCKEFFGYAKEELNRTLASMDANDSITKQGYQLSIWLSAVITHQETCIDGFPDGEFKDKVKLMFLKGKELTSNALAFIEKAATFLAGLKLPQRRLLVEEKEAAPRRAEPALGKDGIPEWVPESERRVLKGGGFKAEVKPNVVVAKDGSGQFKTINEALIAMPKKYDGRYVIQLKAGVYDEYVTITSQMPNVTLTGDGSKTTIITGKKNFVDGITTFKSATFTAQGDGFMAIGVGFENTAGAAKHQAVALLVLADKSIFLNCKMDGFQDTLYAHSKAQFYRNCDISGTIDFIFGDAAAVFQNCIITLRRPLDNQQNIVTAHGRADAREATGFVLQKCQIVGEPALTAPGRPPIKNYLARPWRECSRTIFMESDLPALIDKAGYLPWNGEFGLKTLYYAEFGNKGPGADTVGRVNWAGYKKVISKDEANKFTLGNFIHPQPWIDPTGTPVKYDFFG